MITLTTILGFTDRMPLADFIAEYGPETAAKVLEETRAGAVATIGGEDYPDNPPVQVRWEAAAVSRRQTWGKPMNPASVLFPEPDATTIRLADSRRSNPPPPKRKREPREARAVIILNPTKKGQT